MYTVPIKIVMNFLTENANFGNETSILICFVSKIVFYLQTNKLSQLLATKGNEDSVYFDY